MADAGTKAIKMLVDLLNQPSTGKVTVPVTEAGKQQLNAPNARMLGATRNVMQGEGKQAVTVPKGGRAANPQTQLGIEQGSNAIIRPGQDVEVAPKTIEDMAAYIARHTAPAQDVGSAGGKMAGVPNARQVQGAISGAGENLAPQQRDALNAFMRLIGQDGVRFLSGAGLAGGGAAMAQPGKQGEQ